MGRPSRYAPEVRERAVRMVFAHQGEHRSQWAAICSIAEKFGCSPETLRKWVRQSERDRGTRSGLTTDQLEELKTLRRENRELRRANEILLESVSVFRPGGARPPTEAMTEFCGPAPRRLWGRADL